MGLSFMEKSCEWTHIVFLLWSDKSRWHLLMLYNSRFSVWLEHQMNGVRYYYWNTGFLNPYFIWTFLCSTICCILIEYIRIRRFTFISFLHFAWTWTMMCIWIVWLTMVVYIIIKMLFLFIYFFIHSMQTCLKARSMDGSLPWLAVTLSVLLW